MTDLPTPGPLGLPQDAVIAVAAQGLTVYRLVRSDAPTLRDFQPPSPERAARLGWPEILRAGLSHFLDPEQAERVQRSPVSLVVRVDLAAGVGIYVARTGRTPGLSPCGRGRKCSSNPRALSREPCVAYDEGVTLFVLFSGADVIGEFDTRDEAESALDEAVAAEPSAADELAVFELDQNGERVGKPITRAAA